MWTPPREEHRIYIYHFYNSIARRPGVETEIAVGEKARKYRFYFEGYNGGEVYTDIAATFFRLFPKRGEDIMHAFSRMGCTGWAIVFA